LSLGSESLHDGPDFAERDAGSGRGGCGLSGNAVREWGRGLSANAVNLDSEFGLKSLDLVRGNGLSTLELLDGIVPFLGVVLLNEGDEAAGLLPLVWVAVSALVGQEFGDGNFQVFPNSVTWPTVNYALELELDCTGVLKIVFDVDILEFSGNGLSGHSDGPCMGIREGNSEDHSHEEEDGLRHFEL